MSTNTQNLWIWVRLRGLRDFIAGTAKAATAVNQISGSFIESGKRIRTHSLLMYKGLQYLRRGFLTLTATAGLGSVALVRGFTSFENQMKAVQSVTSDSGGLVEGVYEKMTAEAIKAASVTKFSNEQAAEALYILASAGLSAKDATDNLRTALQLAQATNSSTKTSTQVLASAINTYGLTAKDAVEVSNYLTRGVARSALEMDDIQYAFKYAAGPAANLGVELSDLVATLGVLADRGIKGRTAGTSLRMTFIRLIDPPKKAKEALKDMNLSIKDFQDSKGGFLPLFDIFGKIQKGTEGMTKAERERALSALVGANAYSAFNRIIAAGPKAWKQSQKEITNEQMTTASVARNMQKTVGASIENTGNIIQGIIFKVIMKYSPMLQEGIRNIGKAALWVEANWDKIRGFLAPFGETIVNLYNIIKPFVKYGLIAIVVAVIALRKVLQKLNPILKFVADHMNVIAPIVLTLVAAFVTYRTVVFSVIAVQKAYVAASVIFGRAMLVLSHPIKTITFLMNLLKVAFVTNPIGMVVVGLLLLGAAFYLAYKKVGWFRDAVNATFDWVKTHWKGLLELLTGPIGLAVVMIVEHWDTLWGATKKVAQKIKDVFIGIKDALGPIFEGIASIATNIFKAVYSGIRAGWNALSAVWEPIKDAVNNASPFEDLPSIPELPALWQGGRVVGGGFAMVGERGPELVHLSQGATVEPLPQGGGQFDLSTIGGGNGPIVTKVYLNGRQIAEAVHDEVQKRRARS